MRWVKNTKYDEKGTGVPEHHITARTEVKLQALQSSTADQGMWSILHFGRCTPDTHWIGTSEDTLTGLEFLAKIKIPASTEYRAPVDRPGTATSLIELPAYYHNLHLSIMNKSSNSVATLTINLFLHLVIRRPIGIYRQQNCHCEAVERHLIFLGAASSTFTGRISDVRGTYNQRNCDFIM
jgi:hypothetical protein